MSVSPPGHWILNRMVFLLNKTLGIISTSVLNSIKNLLKDANTFTGINTFMGGINVDNIDSINGNTTFNSEIIVNSNITANDGSFIGDNLVINNIETNTIFSNTLNINTISLEDSSSPYITFQDDIRLNKGINIIGNLIVNGSTFTVNRQTLTINDRFITLNANLSNLNHAYTDPAGIIVETHDTDKYSRGSLLWTLFDPNDPANKELNRTWDLSGDNLRGNVLKATTLKGNILDSYYSPNISVISDIDMNNNDISNINTLTASDINATNINATNNISISGQMSLLGPLSLGPLPVSLSIVFHGDIPAGKNTPLGRFNIGVKSNASIAHTAVSVRVTYCVSEDLDREPTGSGMQQGLINVAQGGTVVMGHGKVLSSVYNTGNVINTHFNFWISTKLESMDPPGSVGDFEVMVLNNYSYPGRLTANIELLSTFNTISNHVS